MIDRRAFLTVAAVAAATLRRLRRAAAEKPSRGGRFAVADARGGRVEPCAFLFEGKAG